MKGPVPRWVGIAYDRPERSAGGAFYTADADVCETCASSRRRLHVQLSLGDLLTMVFESR